MSNTPDEKTCPPPKPSTEERTYSKPLPQAKRGAFLSTAESLSDAGINTPEQLASTLAGRFEGKVNEYSQTLWNLILAFDESGVAGQNPNPDWRELYEEHYRELRIDEEELTDFQKIARSESLATEWGREMFPLEDVAYNARLLLASKILKALGFESRAVGSYLQALPLLLENEAIAKFIARNESFSLLNEYPNVVNPDEAAQLMAMDRMFSDEETNALKRMLDLTTSTGRKAMRVWGLINFDETDDAKTTNSSSLKPTLSRRVNYKLHPPKTLKGKILEAAMGNPPRSKM